MLLIQPRRGNQQNSFQGISTSEDLHVCEGHMDHPNPERERQNPPS